MSLDLNVTYILVLVLFLIPLVFLNAILFKPFLKLFEERHERLEGAVVRAEGMLAQAEERAETFNEKIKVATARGIEKRNEIRASARAEMDARIDEEKKVLAGKLESALGEIEKKRREAHADIIVEAEKIAELTASKLLGRNV
ncbi:MAG: ATP synthase F0 subunit B [Deltaproteobacteria bacterium]|jgi:F-type H+-transporting ATPase subunit b